MPVATVGRSMSIQVIWVKYRPRRRKLNKWERHSSSASNGNHFLFSLTFCCDHQPKGMASFHPKLPYKRSYFESLDAFTVAKDTTSSCFISELDCVSGQTGRQFLDASLWRRQPFQAKELVIIATGDVTTSSLPVAGIGSPEILSWRFSLSSQRWSIGRNERLTSLDDLPYGWIVGRERVFDYATTVGPMVSSRFALENTPDSPLLARSVVR